LPETTGRSILSAGITTRVTTAPDAPGDAGADDDSPGDGCGSDDSAGPSDADVGADDRDWLALGLPGGPDGDVLAAPNGMT
jgi:hypothetical protein